MGGGEQKWDPRTGQQPTESCPGGAGLDQQQHTGAGFSLGCRKRRETAWKGSSHLLRVRQEGWVCVWNLVQAVPLRLKITLCLEGRAWRWPSPSADGAAAPALPFYTFFSWIVQIVSKSFNFLCCLEYIFNCRESNYCFWILFLPPLYWRDLFYRSVSVEIIVMHELADRTQHCAVQTVAENTIIMRL